MELKCPASAAAALAARPAKFRDVRVAKLVKVHAEHQHAVVLDVEFLLLHQPKPHRLQKMLRPHLQKMLRLHLQKTLLLHRRKAHQRRDLV